MNKHWIVVADAAQARILLSEKETEALVEIDSLQHPEARLHEGQLRTGGKGEVFQSTGDGQHQTEPQVTTMQKHADIFAKELAAKLRDGRVNNEYEALTIVAAPEFLGHLRKKLDSSTSKCVNETVDKNWTDKTPDQINDLLAA